MHQLRSVLDGAATALLGLGGPAVGVTQVFVLYEARSLERKPKRAYLGRCWACTPGMPTGGAWSRDLQCAKCRNTYRSVRLWSRFIVRRAAPCSL